MPEYYGSKQSAIRPHLNRPQETVPTEEQVNQWWEALTKGLNEDPEIGRDLDGTDRNSLYFFDDNSNLVPAVDVEENTSDEYVRRRLMEQAQNGRLYIRAVDEKIPRQIRTDRKEPFHCAVAERMWRLPQDKLPEPPKKPFFLKRWFPFFFREEIAAYEEKKRVYDEAVQEKKWITDFGKNSNGDLFQTDYDAGKMRPDYAQRSQAKEKYYQQQRENEQRKIEREQAAQRRREKALDERNKALKQRDRHTDKADRISVKLGIMVHHPDLLKETKYKSPEDFFDAIDRGEDISSIWEEENRYRHIPNTPEKGKKGCSLLEVWAKALKFNNQRINRYTPDQTQFQYIAKVNLEILHSVLWDEEMLSQLKEQGVTQEDLQLAAGTVEVSYAYEDCQKSRESLLFGMYKGNILSDKDVAMAVAGEMVYGAIALHNKACEITGESSPNQLLIKAGVKRVEGRRAGKSFIEELAEEVQKNEKYQEFKDDLKDPDEMLATFSDPAKLRKSGVGIMTKDMDSRLGLDYVPPKKEVVKEEVKNAENKEEEKGENKEEEKEEKKGKSLGN